MKKMKDNIGRITSIVSAIVVCLLALIKESAGLKTPGFTWVFWAIVGLTLTILLAYGIYLIVNAIKNKKRNRNMVDTTSILERSRRVTKDIKNVISTVEKTIKKYVEEHDTLDEDRKKQFELAKNNIVYLVSGDKKHKDRVIREVTFFDNINPKNIKEGLTSKDHTQEELFLLNQSVINSIKEINRALLVLEQYDTRIYLGDYLLSHSSNVYDCADALIDYKGWTYALIGKRDKFVQSVNEGIELLTKYEKDTPNLSDDEKAKIHLKLARAHRHLGSEVIFAKEHSEDAILENEKALNELNCFKHLSLEWINENIKDKKEKEKQMSLLCKVEEMRVGIEYGKLNARMFMLIKRRSKDTDINLANELLECITLTRGLIDKSKTFANPHRYLKCILLENEFLKMLEPTLSNSVIENSKDKLDELFGKQNDIKRYVCTYFDNNTAVADDVFKNAIYADEMMEVYINQEATQLFRIIKEIGRQ